MFAAAGKPFNGGPALDGQGHVPSTGRPGKSAYDPSCAPHDLRHVIVLPHAAQVLGSSFIADMSCKRRVYVPQSVAFRVP